MAMTFEEWMQEMKRLQDKTSGLDASQDILGNGTPVQLAPEPYKTPDAKDTAFSMAESASANLGPLGLPVAMTLGAINSGTKTPEVGKSPDYVGGMQQGAKSYALSTLLQQGGDLLKDTSGTVNTTSDMMSRPQPTNTVSLFDKPSQSLGDTYNVQLLQRDASGSLLNPQPTYWDKLVSSSKQAGSDILRGATKGASDIVMGTATSGTPKTGAVGLDFVEGFKRGGDLGNIYASAKEGNVGGASGQTLKMVMREYPSFDATIKAQEEERRKKLRGY